MFELYLLMVVVWWIALVTSAIRNNHLNHWFEILFGVTLLGDVLMGMTFLGWVTDSPLFQEMNPEIKRKCFTHFFLPWFAPQVLILLGGVAYYGRSRADPKMTHVDPSTHGDSHGQEPR